MGCNVPSRKPRSWLIAVAVVVLAVAAFGSMVWFGQRSLIYYPDRWDPGSVVGRTSNAEDVELTTQDGLTLTAWLLHPVTDATQVAVVYFPGNGANRLSRLGLADAIRDRGYTVLLVDYRGYGGNPGTPTETGLNLDARAAVAYLRDHGFSEDHLIYFGESLGTGVAIRLAVTAPPAGIVLRSPFTSLADVAKHQLGPAGWLPVKWLLRDRFDTVGYLPQVEVPITVLCGSADTLVPASQSKTVAQKALNLHRLSVVEGANHNDDVWFGDYVATAIDDLARAVVPVR